MSFYNAGPPPIGFDNLPGTFPGHHGLPPTYPLPAQPSYSYDQPAAPVGYASYPPAPQPMLQGPSYGYPAVAGSGFPVPDFVGNNAGFGQPSGMNHALPYPVHPGAAAAVPATGYPFGPLTASSMPYAAPSHPSVPPYGSSSTVPGTYSTPANYSVPPYGVAAPTFASVQPQYGGAQLQGVSSVIAVQGEGTVKPFYAFNAEQDAQALRKAMKGIGTDEQAIINILGRRSNQQRLQLKLTYKTLFGRDLTQDLSSELSFRFKQTVLALMMSPAEYDASELNRAIRGVGTNEEALAEILCTRNNMQLMSIKAAYHNLYKKQLERDLVGDTSGHFRRFVVSLTTANRSENNYVDVERARREAQELYRAGEGRWGTDESKFNQILCSQSFAQLRATFAEYQRVAHRSIQQALVREMSGDLLMGMKTLVDVVENTPGYFANRLYRAMRGVGTNDDVLIRVVVSRCEVDMVQIKQEFQRQHGQTLEAFIQSDTSGDYRKLLLLLVQGNQCY